MGKLIRAIRSPRRVGHVIRTRYLGSLLRGKVFVHAEEYRSDSENGMYASAILKALKNQRNFENFKRMHSYRDILEHVSRGQGAEYLRLLESRDDKILERGLQSVLLSDGIGNPIKFSYERYAFPLSPTTLRYLKVASDLKILFGADLGNVAEIGCGYGGQTLVNDQLLSVRSAKLFDLPLVNKLIERYLDAHLLNGAYGTTVINRETRSHYDLVISNYAFSELPKKLQVSYIDKVLAHSARGYLTMNSGLAGVRSVGKLTLGELRELLPEFKVMEERPLTSQDNYIIVWGHNEEAAKKYFSAKNCAPA